MKRKSWIGLMLCVTLLAGLLAGCGKREKPDPTTQWINATYAILTAANHGNINKIGGYAKNDQSKAVVLEGLEEWWEVTDRASADENLNWLLEEGHRTSYRKEMAILKEEGLMGMSEIQARLALKDWDLDADGVSCYVAMLSLYKEKGDQAIDAWDYCRALQMLGWYYVGDLYTKEETLDKSLEIAKQLQEQYGSWEELCESYLAGYNYWTEDDPEDPDSDTAARRKIYDTLRSQKNGPYTLDWNTSLEKTW